jgi:hypothetical protein
MCGNIQEGAIGAGEISQNIYGVSTTAEETTQGSNQTQDAANELLKLAVDLQGLAPESLQFKDLLRIFKISLIALLIYRIYGPILIFFCRRRAWPSSQ